MTERGSTAPAAAPVPAPHAKQFRPDVEGLRAVAVLLVVAFHAGIGVVGGGFVGVDVFFVISGFLITALLVDEHRRTGAVSLTAFYARRIRRLLPLGTLVLVATTLVSLMALPAIDRPAIADDATSAALWWANWHFAGQATDYMSDVDLSPVLHYWSLSVEEQFYVVWPLLILLVTRGRKLSWRVRRARLTAALLALCAGSFLLSALTTKHSGPWAYFGLHTRAWELAAGGLLALAVPALSRVSRSTAAAAGWVGLAAVVGSAVLLSRDTAFPGTAAAWPVVGTVLLLAAGARSSEGASALLARPWMTYVGRISYGWYLWHWPCLVLAKAIWGNPDADPDLGQKAGPGGFVILCAVLVSFGLAAATYRLVEQPVRESRTLALSRPLTFGLGAALLVTAVGGSQALLNPSTPVSVASGLQTPAEAKADTGTPDKCFVDFAATKADPTCRFGDKRGRRVVVLLGDSHAAHWVPAMEQIAKERHWQLWFWAKPACAFADVRQFTTIYKREFTECATWRANVMKRVADLPRVDTVVVGRNYSYLRTLLDEKGKTPTPDAASELWEQGAARSFQQLSASAKEVVMLRDVPRPGGDVPNCLSRNSSAPDKCSFPKKGHTDLDKAMFTAEQRALPSNGRIHYIDMSSAICPADPCSVISPDGAVVFRDLHHLTGRFSRELAPVLEKKVLRYVLT
jgi:peptidoglycan/LPS O-acetylase OafA/YrhL